MSKVTVGNETIYVLNNNYQYQAAVVDQEANSKWLDTANVMSVKRDKTIYAIRARNNFDFTNPSRNTEWFANTVLAYLQPNMNASLNTQFCSNLWKGFQTSLTGNVDNFMISRPICVYGNVSSAVSANVNQLGIAGSLLETNFNYGMNGMLSGNVNVSSSVCVWANIINANAWNGVGGATNYQLPGSLGFNCASNTWTISPTVDTTGVRANVDPNTAFKNLFYADNTGSKWNRLINANLNGNLWVTASTDPTDLYGNAISTSYLTGNAFNNEAWRHQFTLQNNPTAARATLNPSYIVRIGRFAGNGLSDVSGSFGTQADLFGFTGNFFANLGADNSLYAKGNTLSQVCVCGNVVNPDVVVFNSNFKSGNLNYSLISSLNGNRTDNALGEGNNNIYLTITRNLTSNISDFINANVGPSASNPLIQDANGNINSGATFKTSDRLGIVQGNLSLSQGIYMLDRITPVNIASETTFQYSSQIFSGDLLNCEPTTSTQFNIPVTTQPNLYYANANLRALTGVMEMNAKYLYIEGTNIIANNWQCNSYLQPSSSPLPNVYMNPNTAIIATGNEFCVYLRRGDMSFDNYTYVNNVTVSDPTVKYIKTVPSFVSSLSTPAGKVTLNDESILNTSGGSLSSLVTSSGLQLGVSVNPVGSGLPVIIAANIMPDLTFCFFGNTNEEERLIKNANTVVANANSFIGNLWSYDSNGSQQTDKPVQFYPKVVYGNLINGGVINFETSPTSIGGNVRALTLNQTQFCQNNLKYRITFPKFVGNTNAGSICCDNFTSFYPNLTGNGSFANTCINSLNGFDLNNVNNRSQLNDILLNGVAYSEYTFSNYSWKFTDLGNVCGLLSSSPGQNYQYNSTLPRYGNANLCSNLNANINSDAFINVLVDYNRFANINGADTDIHRLTVYDVQYRYFINDVLRTGAGPLVNQQQINSSSDIVGNLFVINGTNTNRGTINGNVAPNLTAPNFVLFTYDKVKVDTPKDIFYPFFSVKDTTGRIDGNVYTDTSNNYLFPGFIYKKTGADAEFFDYKDDASVDFVIDNNGTTEKNISVGFYGVDVTNKTVKVALSTDTATKTIDMRPIRYSNSGNCSDWYSYLVFKIAGEANSYVVMLYKLNSTGSTLSSDVAPYLPVNVGIKAIEKSMDGFNQVRFKSALRVYNSSGTLQNTYSNTVNAHKTRLSLMSYSSQVGSPDTNVGVNIYSQPINTIIISFAYTQQVIKKLLSYQRADYRLPENQVDLFNGNAYVKEIATGLLFAASNTNATNAPVADSTDPRLSLIPANASRYYLDQGYGNGVYIDIANNSVLTPQQLGTLRIDRSVEWRVYRSLDLLGATETLVGRGLLTRTGQPDSQNNSMPSLKLDYYLTENNMLVEGSGFYMRVNTNIVDFAARLYYQNIQNPTCGGIQNPLELVLKTKADNMLGRLYFTNPCSFAQVGSPSSTIVARNLGVSSTFDLGALFNGSAGSLPVFTLGCFRGYGSNGNNDLAPPLNNALFSVRVRTDNYALIQSLPGTTAVAQNITLAGNVLFSKNTYVKSTADFYLLFDNQSLAYSYISPPLVSPTLNPCAFVKIECCYHQGYGNVRVYTKDFTSNYNNEIPCREYVNGTNTAYANQALAAYQVTKPGVLESYITCPIRYDGSACSNLGKFYIVLNAAGAGDDKLFFRGVGTNSQPLALNGKYTLVLYSGTRPLVINAVLLNSSATLQLVQNGIKQFQNNSGIFNEISAPYLVNGGGALGTGVTQQLFYTVLTNSNATGNIQVRSYNYVPSARYFSDPTGVPGSRNLFWLGTYMNANSFLQDLCLNVRYSDTACNKTVRLQLTLVSPYPDPVQTDEQLFNSAVNNSSCGGAGTTTFSVSTLDNTNWFYINVNGYIPNYTGFESCVRPSKVLVYEAIDANNNGELDSQQTNNIKDIGTISTQFGLNNSFSELLYNLTVVNGQEYQRPDAVQQFSLARNVFTPIVGSQMSIAFNNLFSVGYNLDCFFVIKHSDVAHFDVLTVSTESNSVLSGSPEMTSLVVRDSAPLMVGTPTDWARNLVTYNQATDATNSAVTALAQASGNYGADSGITFKVRQNRSIVAGETVRLFVDNTINTNTLEWTVSCSNTQSNKSYKIYSYDQERYAALLDEQIRMDNNFV